MTTSASSRRCWATQIVPIPPAPSRRTSTSSRVTARPGSSAPICSKIPLLLRWAAEDLDDIAAPQARLSEDHLEACTRAERRVDLAFAGLRFGGRSALVQRLT